MKLFILIAKRLPSPHFAPLTSGKQGAQGQESRAPGGGLPGAQSLEPGKAPVCGASLPGDASARPGRPRLVFDVLECVVVSPSD